MYLTQGLHRAVQRTPHAVATICEGRVRTFEAQLDRVARAAGGLVAMGVRPGDRVGIVAANSDHYLEFLLAASWAGAVSNPVNARWNPLEIAFALNDSDTRVLVVGENHEDAVPVLHGHCPGLARVISLRTDAEAVTWEQLIAGSDPVDDVRIGGDSLAAVIYTGGTTGTPKGVTLSHSNLITSALGTLATGEFLTPGGRLLTVAPLFHLAGIWPWLAQTILGGSHMVLGAFSPEAVTDLIEEHEVTETLLVPMMLQGVVEYLERSGRCLPTLRHLIYAGSSISEDLLTRAQATLPGVGLVQGYGMTETAPVATLLGPADHTGARLRSAGRAAPHAEVRILDAAGQEVPRGQIGEIVVYGAQVMRGYLNRPELTATAVRDGGMHTGDAGYMDDDGYVFVVDRIKDMIITGGENVYSAEVENALASHPAVRASAVIALPDPQWGERVHAVIVAAPGARVELEQLREHCAARIARYKLPRSMEVVEQLPTSAAGKTLKHELRRERARVIKKE
jgi:acyl-CoA synthetase (AMP-forming)/AMP-acid ligase II